MSCYSRAIVPRILTRRRADTGQPAVQKTAESGSAEKSKPSEKVDVAVLIDSAAKRLVELQEQDGAWPYEGVYRVPPSDSGQARRSEFVIPVGYRIGGSAIVCSALISATLTDRTAVDKAITKSTELILKELENPLMKPSQADQYDVRVWGHIYALDYFCRLHETAGFEELKKQTDPWIEKLADAVVFGRNPRGRLELRRTSSTCEFCHGSGPSIVVICSTTWCQGTSRSIPARREDSLRQPH